MVAIIFSPTEGHIAQKLQARPYICKPAKSRQGCEKNKIFLANL